MKAVCTTAIPAGVGRIVQKCKIDKKIDGVKQHQKNNSADQIKIKMHKGRSLRILFSPDGGQQRRNAGTDILTHNNRKGGPVGYGTGHAQGLENSHRGRRALDKWM